jgi:hypothetical protein
MASPGSPRRLFRLFASRHRIESAGVPRMTSSDPLRRHPSTLEDSVALDRRECVARTGGSESARRRQQRGNRRPIESDRPDEGSPGPPHRCNTTARAVVSRSAASTTSPGALAIPLRATSATSAPSHGPPTRRHDARMTRLQRLRMTAPPSFLPAMKTTRPSRPTAVGDSTASTTRRGCVARLPASNKCSISRGDRIVCTVALLGLERPGRDQALKTDRPLRRLLASTARPPRVDIRSRNP